VTEQAIDVSREPADGTGTEPSGPAVSQRRSLTRVPTRSLRRGYSPRSAGEIEEHTRLLAEADRPLPPILVHRPTMRVIDGMHRLHAAVLQGEESVSVEFFDGDEAEAFVAAVRANVTHGLPLTLSDRKAAVERLIVLYPDRSDRWISGVAQLSSATVGAIRARVAPERSPTPARIGRDGRTRPLSSADARAAASEIINERPDASLREVASITGLSPATVHDVRARMRRGDDPVPKRERDNLNERRNAPARRRVVQHVTKHEEPRDRETLLQILDRDPALRFSEAGRLLLRWIAARTRGIHDWRGLVDAIPPHCAYIVAELANVCAGEWSEFGDALNRRLNEIAE
jgi:hypothetical protein